MKEIQTLLLYCGVLLLAIAWPVRAGAMDAADAPDSVTLDRLQHLYKAVEFDHRMHAESFDCAACHHHTAGGGTRAPGCTKCHADSPEAAEVACSSCHAASGPAVGNPAGPDGNRYHIDRPGLLGALHLQCLGCHRAESGPLGCEECHALSPAGARRFAVAGQGPGPK